MAPDRPAPSTVAPPSPPRATRPRPRSRFRDALGPWIWLAPILVPFILFLLLPVLEVVRLSFHRWEWYEETFVGLGQYRRLFRDPEFGRALLHTLVFTVCVVPGWLFLSLLVATLLTPLRPAARSAAASVFYLTYLVSPVVLGLVWTWMLAPDETGLLNRGLAWIGVGPLPWLASPRMALASVILSTVLTIPGSGVLLYGAAISALPEELFEAARLDGAGRIARWRAITIPLLRPTTLYLAVIYTIASFQVFDRVYVMTGGGPAGATTVLVERIHTDAFFQFEFGAASAQSVVLLLLIAAVAHAQFRWMKGGEQF